MTKGKSGFVAIIGRPNVGKSTLLNSLIGEKISITSPKPQTTRWQILGIKTLGTDSQIIYIDTPGMHTFDKKAMNRYLNRIASSVLLDADLIVMMMAGLSWHKEDDLVIQKLKAIEKPVILVVNKVDLIKDKSLLLPLITELQAKYHFAHIIPVSALDGDNVELLESEILNLLPEGPLLYPEEQITDKNERFQVAEIIREKLIEATEEELPYATTVEIEQFEQKDKLIEVGAVIWVERSGQKIIIIGKGGSKLKKIGTAARRELEMMFDQKVFLRLWVKVKKDWTDSDKALRTLGYQ